MAIHIIIDGYNLIRQSDTLNRLDRQDIQTGREVLIDLLAAYKRLKAHRITVVFDGADAPVFSNRRDRLKGIAVRFSGQGETADAVIKKMAVGMGFEGILMSDFRKLKKRDIPAKTVLILDTLGDLKAVLGRANVVFMGGSLVKRGGHNIVEPAMFGKPIVFGPHMFNFRNMAQLFLKEKAALKVADKAGLASTLESLLLDREKADAMGQRAKKLLEKQKGAAIRNVNGIAHFMGRDPQHEG